MMLYGRHIPDVYMDRIRRTLESAAERAVSGLDKPTERQRFEVAERARAAALAPFLAIADEASEQAGEAARDVMWQSRMAEMGDE
ncbi:MAG: hypothetical protein EKK62_12920 [Acidimicrobiia bacterium]|nr:MAG: hypothetical protein EKK62_12920 [Acidimicrobiia bacterium]